MPTFGTAYRTKPRLRIRKGWCPVDPMSLIQSLPAKAGEAIKSGMIVCLDPTAKALVKATKALVDAGARPFVATADQDDFSVASSELLPVIVCDGNFELETAYFDAGTYNDGDLIGVSGSNAGYLTSYNGADASAVAILGIANAVTGVSAIRSYKGALPNTGINDEADPASFDGNVVSLHTKHIPVLDRS